jgi:YD repeat-containing protein
MRAVDALGGTTRMEYDDENHLIKTTDANNLVTVYTLVMQKSLKQLIEGGSSQEG